MVDEPVVVTVLPDIACDGAALELAEVVVVPVLTVSDKDFSENVVLNDAAQRADVVLTVRVICRGKDLANLVRLFGKQPQRAGLVPGSVEDELVVSFGIDDLRVHERVCRRSVRTVIDPPELNSGGIGLAVPTFAFLFAIGVVEVFKDVAFDCALKDFGKVVLRCGGSTLHSGNVDLQRRDFLTVFSALGAEVEILPALWRDDIRFGEDLVGSRQEIVAGKFVVTVSVGRRCPFGPVRSNEEHVDIGNWLVLAEIVITIDVVVGVNVTRHRNRFGGQIDIIVDSSLIDTVVAVVGVVWE